MTGESQLDGHPTCITEPSQVHGPFKAILLTSKAHATARLAQDVAPLLANDGVMLSLQNGFGNGTKAARAVGASRVAVATTSQGVDLLRPGHLLHAGKGATHVGPLDATGAPAAQRAFALLASAGLEPEWHDDMRAPVWRKALLNHAVNPLAALAGARNGEMLDEPHWSAACRLLAEGYALSRAAGVALPGDLEKGMRDTLERTPRNRCSMLQDVEARRPTEVEQLSGHLVRLGRRLGYPMPESDAVYRRLKALEASYLGEAASLALTRAETETADLSAPF